MTKLLTAVKALGALPDGYCFCSRYRLGDNSKTHEPECAQLRAAIEEQDDFAAIGESLVNEIAVQTRSGPLQGWVPADSPVEVVVYLLNLLDEAQEDAARYRWLRSRDLDTIDRGGIFIGETPANLLLNLADADSAIDRAMQGEAESG